ncbi:MAG: exodeoxyribonuclease I [Candidatus Saccharimonadales bacterium]
MAASFFFYDLETSGINSRSARIMQFAGQRTDTNLNPIGEPVNSLIRLTPDVVPEPDAIMITGITPQQTLTDGYTEAEFLRYFYDEVVQPDTIFVGFNSVRFDDEFMRFLHYRNFYDPYEWQWQNGCSRWDILDVVRMTRALRPDGIEWPFAPDGKPANRLEFLTKVNKLDHTHAHDALSDVVATIAVAKLVKDKQPKLFEHLLNYRGKKAVAELIERREPFVYTTGKYPSANLHTSVALWLGRNPNQRDELVYDLRHDPTPFLAMSVEQLSEAWKYTKEPDVLRLPIKTMKTNHCPAVAPLGVIKDPETQSRINLTLETVSKHLALLKAKQPEFTSKLMEVIRRADTEREQTYLLDNPQTVDERLYEKFFGNEDKQSMGRVRAARGEDLNVIDFDFADDRLRSLLPLYKARNFPQALSSEERQAWDEFCHLRVFEGGTSSRLAKFFARLTELAADDKLSDEKKYLLEELQLYGQSIVPADAAE